MKHPVRLFASAIALGLVIGCGDASKSEKDGASTASAEVPALSPDVVVGDWTGVLNLPTGASLPIVLHITQDDTTGELAMTLDSPDQGAFGIGSENVRIEDGYFRADITRIAASLIFEPGDDADTMKAVFNQGLPLPFELKRGIHLKERNRPQEPTERPYVIEEVTFPGGADGVTLAGELTLPEGTGPFPAAILISGSGPQDRNEELMQHKPFLILSDDLTRKGYAVLRYDDRGTAESTGEFGGATTLDFATDAAAAMAFLKADSRVDASRTVYIGHSEGGYIAPLAAEIEPVAAMVLLAGPSKPLGEVIVYQTGLLTRAGGAPEAMVERMVANTEKALQILRETPDDAEVVETIAGMSSELGIPESTARAQAQALANPWMRWALDFDPMPKITAFDGPVLALFGSKDLQVAPSQNLDAMKAGLTQPGSEVIVLDGLNHLFQPAETGAMTEYIDIETTFDPAALNAISTWLDANL